MRRSVSMSTVLEKAHTENTLAGWKCMTRSWLRVFLVEGVLHCFQVRTTFDCKRCNVWGIRCFHFEPQALVSNAGGILLPCVADGDSDVVPSEGGSEGFFNEVSPSGGIKSVTGVH